MQKVYLFVWALLLAACSIELPREAPYDAKSPLSLQAKGALSGTIQLEGETDFSQVTVQLQNATYTYSVDTDALGAVMLTGVVPGQYQLSIRTRYFEPVSQTVQIRLAEQADIGTHTLPPLKAPVLGLAQIERLESGAPVIKGGVTVRLRKSGSIRGGAPGSPGSRGYRPLGDPQERTTPTYTTVSDNAGAYQFSDIPAGHYTVNASTPDSTELTVGEVTVTGEANALVGDVVLRPLSGFFAIVGYADGVANPRYSNAPVRLLLTAVNPFKMRLGSSTTGKSADCIMNAEQDFVSVINDFTSLTEGENHLCVVYIGENGDKTDALVESIVYDVTPPEPVVFLLNGGATHAKTSQVTVSLQAVDIHTPVAVMQLGTVANFAGVETRSYLPALVYPVNTSGPTTLHVRFQDAAGNYSGPISATIFVDSFSPTVSQFRVEDDAGSPLILSSLAHVAVRFVAADVTPLQMMLSNTADFAGVSWQPYQELTLWDVLPGQGTRFVYGKIRDAAGNEVDGLSSSFTIDTVPPQSPTLALSPALTSDTTVLVTLGAIGADFVELSSSISFLSPQVVPMPQATASFSFTGDDGVKTLFARYGDTAGNLSAIVSAEVTLDRAPPENPQFSILQISPTKAGTLNLTLSAGGASQMSISEGGCTEDWGTYAQSAAHILSTGVPGLVTIAVHFRDLSNNRSACIMRDILFDNEPPQLLVTPFQINYGALSTSSNVATLTFNVTGAIELQVSEDAGFADTNWLPYTGMRTFTLSAGNTDKTVHARFRDAADNQTVTISQTIALDTSPITAPYINIQADVTSATTINIVLSASGVAEMKLSELADLSDAAWETYVANRSFSFSSGDGTKRLYAKFRKASLAESEIVSDTYVLDTTPPILPGIRVNNGATVVSNPVVTLNLSAIDQESAVEVYQVNSIALFPATQRSFQPNDVYTLAPAGDGMKTIFVIYGDRARNFSVSALVNVTLDTTPPQIISASSLEQLDGTAISSGNTVRDGRVVLRTNVSDITTLEMQVSTTGSYGMGWEPYNANKIIDLSAASSNIIAQVRDAAGHVTPLLAATDINLDNTPPVLTFTRTSASPSNNLTVSLSLAASETSSAQVSTSTGFGGAGWFSTAATTLTLSAGDGIRTIYARAKDGAGNLSDLQTITVSIDQTPPQNAAFTILAGTITNNRTLNLNYTGVDIDNVRLSEDSCTGSYASHAGSGVFSIATGGDGVKTIAVQFQDAVGNVTPCLTKTITLDETAPVFGFLYINANAAFATSRAISIGVSVTDATEMQLSENAGFSGAAWLPVTGTVNFTLSAGEGAKTVNARFRDDANNIITGFNDSIVVDSIVPIFHVFGGAAVTSGTNLSLSLTASGADEMRLSENADFSAASWVTLIPVTAFAIANVEGQHTVYAQVRDNAGNESAVRTFTTMFDSAAPDVPVVSIVSGAYTKLAGLTVQTIADGAAEMQISQSPTFAGATWVPYGQLKSFTLVGGESLHSVYVKVRDAAGNPSGQANVTVTLDQTAPQVFMHAENGQGTLLTQTNQTRYYMNLTVTDATTVMAQFNSLNSFSGAISEPVSVLRAWDVVAPTAPLGTNYNTYVRVVDAAGNATVVGPVTVLVDTVGPKSPTLALSSGLVSDTTVNVTMSASNAYSIELSEDITFLSPDILVYTTSTTHTFSSTADGAKNLYARFADSLGNYSPIVQASTVLDTTAPDNANFTIVQTSPTKQSTLNLQLTASGATQMSIAEGACSTNWVPYGQTQAHVLSSNTPGTYTIAVRFRDAVDNRSACLTKDIDFDNVLPTLLAAPFQLNNGAAVTSQTQVNLSFNVAGATELRVSTDAGFADAAWVPYAPRDFLLPPGDGVKTVYAQFRDAADNQTSILDQSILLDTTPPEISIAQLNGGASYAASLAVTLTVVATGDPVVMNIRDEAGDLYGGSFDAVTTVTLSPGAGNRTVSVKLWDAAGNGSERIFRSIEIDEEDPRGTVSIASDTLRIASESTSLNLTAVDDGSGLRGVKLVNESAAALAGAPEVSFDAAKVWNLAAVSPGTDALRTVWYQVFDKAGNASAPVSDTVIVDKLAPAGAITLSAAITNQTLIGVDLSYAADTVSMKISAGNLCAGGNWGDAAGEALWTLAPTDGQKEISVRFRDQAGNLSTCYSASVILDTQGPIPTQLTLTGSGSPLQGYSNSPTITVGYATGAADCAMAEFAEDVGFVALLNSETDCANSIPYSFSNAADGFKNLYVRFLDNLGNVGPVTSATVVVDANVPAVEVAGGFSIAEGFWVNNAAITLQLGASGATRVRYGEGAGCGFTATAYANMKSLTLSAGDAAKTVSAQYLDDAGNTSACYAKTITLDTFIAGFTLSLQGHDGYAVRTANQAVTVTTVGINPADALEMRVSNLASFTGSSWEPLATSFDWILTSGDGTKNVYMAIRDRAGNTADATNAIILDQTPTNAPALQVLDINGDGFAISATSVELSWSLPTGASLFELQRFVNAKDSDFQVIAQLSSLQSTYVDDVTQPGFPHNYRIRAIDSVGNTSDWSIVATAMPFEPVTEMYWNRDASANYRFDFIVQPGTFSLAGTYLYEDLAGATISESLLDNSTIYERPADWMRYNERFVLRTANADNGLVYETTLPVGLQVREVVDSEGWLGWDTSIKLDAAGNTHISYWDFTNSALKYATNASGAWVATTVDNTGSVGQWASLALDANGKAHISYYDDFPNRDLKYATNASGSWVLTSVDTVGNLGEYTSLALDAAGKVHISYYDWTNSALKYATNASGSWVLSFVENTAGNIGFPTSLALDSAGKAHISYRDFTNSDLKYATNASGVWVLASVDTVGNVGDYSSIALDAAGKVHISYNDLTNSDLKYATNASGIWVPTSVDTVGNVGTYTSLALDAAGKAHISYSDNTNFDLKYANNTSGSWVLTSVDTAGNVGTYTSITMDAAGKVYISYHDATNTDLKVATQLSSTWTTVGVDTVGSVGEYTSIALDPNGKVHMSHHGGSNDLKYTTNSSGTWVSTVLENNAGEMGEYTSIAVDAAGKVHISYYDGMLDDLKYATNASGVWVFTSVDTVGDVGKYTSIALDAAGKAHIGYLDITNTAMKYATNASGSWVLTTVDNTGEVGEQASLALDSTGKAHLSYREGLLGQNRSLKYATNATGSWVATSVDTAGDVGYFTAIKVDAAGKPHISYFDATNQSQKYATLASGSWIAAIIDTALGPFGGHTSIALDADGKAHVSYRHNAALKYATNVSDEWDTTSVDTTGAVGEYSSIALDADGQAHISYRDGTTFDLNYATHFNGRTQSTQFRLVTAF